MRDNLFLFVGVAETYWKVKNRIRLTGMPGFEQSLSEMEMWQVRLLLQDADKLPASVKRELGKSIYK